MVLSVNELRARFTEAKYIVEEDTIREVYLAGVMQKPMLIEGPPGCNKTELTKAVTFALDTKMERLHFGVIRALRAQGVGNAIRASIEEGDRPGLRQPFRLCKQVVETGIYLVAR